MATREREHYVVDFFSEDNTNRGEVLERDSPPFQQALKPPPPVGLSLRTRESSALALKHIFDKIYSSAESNPKNHCNSLKKASERRESSDVQAFNGDGSNAASYQGGGRSREPPPGWRASDFLEERITCASETETSFGKVKPQGLPMHDLVLGGSASNPPFGHPQTSLPQAVTRPSPPTPLMKQPTAQLTIFYSGTVNVYDDVAADKANAIMLLAGTGYSSMIKSTEGDKHCAPSRLKPPSPLHMGPAQGLGGPASTSVAPTSNSKAKSFNMPPASNIVSHTMMDTFSSPPNGSPALPLVVEPQPQSMPKRPRAGIELPHARKASLARFLEKRKDRVQVKPQDSETTPQEEKGETCREERPSSPKKPYLTGLSSPMLQQ